MRNRITPVLLMGITTILSLFPPLQGTPAGEPSHLETPAGISQTEFEKAMESANRLQIVYRAIYDTVRPSVVQVIAIKSPPSRRYREEYDPMDRDPFFKKFYRGPGREASNHPVSLGSGFIVHNSGIVITNNHVVENATEIQIKLSSGKTVEGILYGRDEPTDIAVLKIERFAGIRSVVLGDSDLVRPGDLTVAVGNPFGLDGTFTTGVISAVGRSDLDGTDLSFLQTDAPVNQGNSGGPLLNLRGEVIGINRMIYSTTGGSMGIGFAIPTNEARTIFQYIKENGDQLRPFLGAHLELPETTEFGRDKKGRKSKFSALTGVRIAHVDPGSQAQHSGLRPRDRIVRANGQPITRPLDLILLSFHDTHEKGIRLTVLRGKKLLSLKIGREPISKRARGL